MLKQYSMFQYNNLENDIYYIENVLSCPELFVNFINDLKENPAISKWSDWNSSGNEVTYGSIKHINKDGLKFIPIDSEIYQRSLYIINSIDMAISISFDGYFEKIQKNKKDFDYYKSLSIRKWNTNIGMGPHADVGYNNPQYTMLIYINDDYDGGEINFPNNNLMLKPKAGSAVIFPSKITHSVNQIFNNNRYTINILCYSK